MKTTINQYVDPYDITPWLGEDEDGNPGVDKLRAWILEHWLTVDSAPAVFRRIVRQVEAAAESRRLGRTHNFCGSCRYYAENSCTNAAAVNERESYENLKVGTFGGDHYCPLHDDGKN